jgi:hypothetical protein
VRCCDHPLNSQAFRIDRVNAAPGSCARENLLVQHVMIMLVCVPEGDVEGMGSCPLGPPSAVHLHQGAHFRSSDAFRLGDQTTPDPDTLDRGIDRERCDP